MYKEIANNSLASKDGQILFCAFSDFFFWCLNLLYTFYGIGIILICWQMCSNARTNATCNSKIMKKYIN